MASSDGSCTSFCSSLSDITNFSLFKNIIRWVTTDNIFLCTCRSSNYSSNSSTTTASSSSSSSRNRLGSDYGKGKCYTISCDISKKKIIDSRGRNSCPICVRISIERSRHPRNIVRKIYTNTVVIRSNHEIEYRIRFVYPGNIIDKHKMIPQISWSVGHSWIVRSRTPKIGKSIYTIFC